jgi:DNA-binding NarL/FixJ family response regulator
VYDRDTALELVARIYDAALNPAAWPAFLDDLATVIGGHAVCLGYVDSATPALSISSSIRWDPAAMRDMSYFRTVDPWTIAGTRKGRYRPGVVGLGEEIVSRSELLRTEFHNDFGRHYSMEGGLAGIILQEAGSVALIGAHRLPNRVFGGEEVELVKMLLPHLERALQMHQRLTRLESAREATADALDKLPVGMILTDPKGRVSLINAAASAILGSRDGLAVSRGMLSASLSRENAQLQQLVAQCAATTTGKGLQSGGAMTISRRSGRDALRLLVTPLRASNRFTPTGVAGAAIFVSDPERQVQTDAEVLRRFHSLTPAEARLAILLASGLTLREATEVSGITTNTGRGYLKNIFSKTNTRTQAQLVRVVLATPTVLPPG